MAGNDITSDMLKQMRASKGVVFPETTTVDIELRGRSLEVTWTTPIGTFGKGTAVAPKTRGGQRSELKPRPIRTWEGFKRCVNALDRRRYIFRGQENSVWRLRSSFYRTGRSNLERYLSLDIADLQKTFSSLTQHTFNLSDPLHYGAFLNLAQHHGYPTPMLDWTWSPYVAAFFAFRSVPKNTKLDSASKIRVFKLDATEWNKLPRVRRLFPIWPNVSILDALAFGNPRAIPQQSLSTITNVDDIETHIEGVEAIRKSQYLEAFDLPASERAHAMHELALMGITAGSLFPGLDGACESLKERNFS